jgi:transposase
MATLADEVSVMEQVTGDLLAGHGATTPSRASRHRPVLAAVIVAEIGDIRRFLGPGQSASLTGVTPATVSSTSRSPAATSPSRGRGSCAGR